MYYIRWWDAFGLPAEQYAGHWQQPHVNLQRKISKLLNSRIKELGFSYDWDREVDATE